jgi:hypothetical protein
MAVRIQDELGRGSAVGGATEAVWGGLRNIGLMAGAETLRKFPWVFTLKGDVTNRVTIFVKWLSTILMAINNPKFIKMVVRIQYGLDGGSVVGVAMGC